MWTTKFIAAIFLASAVFSHVLGQNNNKVMLAEAYMDQGETDKAFDLYEELADNKKNIPYIHNQYFNLLLQNQRFEEAERYLEKVLKYYPTNYYYQIDLIVVLQNQGQTDLAKKNLAQLVKNNIDNQTTIRSIGQYLYNRNLADESIEVYLQARAYYKDDYLFSIDLANLYLRLSRKEEMIKEYLKFAEENPANQDYVKRVMQSYLTEEDLDVLDNVLLTGLQKNPDKLHYSELLIWSNLQRKDFNGAFIQARAIDKKVKQGSRRVMEIGYMAYQNADYETAAKIFGYAVNNMNASQEYIEARSMKIRSEEELLKRTNPISDVQVRNLIVQYETFIVEIGDNMSTLEAKRNMALLYAFYLDEKDTAIVLLNDVIVNGRMNRELTAMTKLDLGDIYLLNKEPWEATLLYSQVEKSENDSPLGYEAKLRNAKLSYFKGDFLLAQEHLDVLKMATSREIANDAISLSLLIKNNTALDTTDINMQRFANVQLLLFQHKTEEARQELLAMLAEKKAPSLQDEILWELSSIHKERREYETAIDYLNQIVTGYGYDILADDAYFNMALLYEDQLQNTEKAMEIYQDFLMRFPGSLYLSEARKRFRKLRGDEFN